MSVVHRHLLLLLHSVSLVTLTPPVRSQNDNEPCPLDFSILRRTMEANNTSIFGDENGGNSIFCAYARQGIRLIQSEYLWSNDAFVPPLASADSCWRSYQRLVDDFYIAKFDVRTTCGFQTDWISQGCVNVTTKQDFESRVSRSELERVRSSCNQSLESGLPCATCVTALSGGLQFTGTSIGNVSDCAAYPLIYAAAIMNEWGPIDPGTANCLFFLDFTSKESNSSGRKRVAILAGSIGGSCVGILVLGLGIWILRMKKRKRGNDSEEIEMGLDAGVVKFGYEEIKKATKNFSADNIIGKGGFGNVYRGEFPDGLKVAVKRFKNCSKSGDESFAHEVRVIASIRHLNLMALRGYCIPPEGHERIIILELMKNGSLHDHLFQSKTNNKLSWPIRQKIAIGTARGLAYLHTGAHHTIIHRDIKAHNILLDDTFEAKVADFGLAKSNPEGATHMSTRVAGTWGYLAPEYAMYGRVTEKSDVYSYGVVLLELLSGRKALIRSDDGEPRMVGDWAWSLAKEGKALDVVEDGALELGSDDDVMVRFVMVAILCSHPEPQVRPGMEEVVKMLEGEMVVPTIPNRPMFMVEGMEEDAEVSVDSLGFSSEHQHQHQHQHQLYGIVDGGTSESS